MTGQQLLVTGGAGFVGSHLVDLLLEAGNTVTVLDDLSVGKMENIAHNKNNPNFRFVRGSILAVSQVERLIAEVDAVYHLAAVVGGKYVVDNPLRGMQVNLRGTVASMNTPEAVGMVFNIGNGREITINQLAQRIRDMNGVTSEIVPAPYEKAYGKNFEETTRRLPDTSRAKRILGFEAQVTLEDGLQQTIQWFAKGPKGAL